MALRQLWALVSRRSDSGDNLRELLQQNETELHDALDSFGAGASGNETALTLACRVGFEAAVGLLVDAGASPNAPNRSGRTAMLIAAAYGQVKCVSALSRCGADMESHNGHDAPLWRASLNGNDLTVKLLLENGANVASESRGMNALHAAAFNDHPRVVCLLISHGLDPATVDVHGNSAMSAPASFLDEENDDEEDHRRPLTPAEKLARVATMVRAREAYLRELNFQRRSSYCHFLVGSGYRPLQSTLKELVASSERDPSAKLPAVLLDTPERRSAHRRALVFSNEGLQRIVASFL